MGWLRHCNKYCVCLDLPIGYLSDDGIPKQMGHVDLSVFRGVVQDCLDYDPKNAKRSQNSGQGKSSKDIEVDKFSGLRIQ